MKVEDIMTKTVVTIEMDDPLSLVKEIFDNAHFHHLLVVDNKKLYGVLSDRDLLKTLSPSLNTAAETDKDRATLKKRAHQIMSRKPITLTKEASVYDAIDIFVNNKISCIPIVDDANIPVGILSWRDILKALQKKRKIMKH